MTFPKVIATARAMFARPLEFYVAMGHGRSYGQESKFFRKKFSGILQSDLWAALQCAPRAQTVAIVADVGNDLAYGAPVETVVAWIDETLARLAQHDARVVLNNLPIESLHSVGELRYRLLKALLFPRSGLSRTAMRERAAALSEALERIAQTREIPVFAGENAWYGFDPIHPRRVRAGEIWRRMLAALDPAAVATAWARPTRADARQLRALHGQSWLRGAAGARLETCRAPCRWFDRGTLLRNHALRRAACIADVARGLQWRANAALRKPIDLARRKNFAKKLLHKNQGCVQIRRISADDRIFIRLS